MKRSLEVVSLTFHSTDENPAIQGASLGLPDLGRCLGSRISPSLGPSFCMHGPRQLSSKVECLKY